MTKRYRCVILPLLTHLPVERGGMRTPPGVDWPMASDEPPGLLPPRVEPEQLKSGKQNKQQLLLG
ncbi:MAG: hypothetical protein E6I80_06085 [Chloroflexi bacterium]|nr:MAG: hypothetical protein E6I80_06085 [Chloroflexota bacterium]